MPVINRIAKFQNDMTAWRRHLHAHPELDFACHNTAAFVVDRLREIGVDQIETGIAKTGLVAVINGTGEGPAIGLRADMDALPITEVRDLPYKSTNDGVMHACGHDGHTAMLLGAARYLAETRKFSGKVALIFQPAEEGGGGGRAMCQEGIMDRFGIEKVFGLHNWPGSDVGRIETCTGPLMAAADTFELTVKGKGAHAAMPHLSVDPVMVAIQIAQGFQTIVSRLNDPLEPAVISITQLRGGTASNVIPEDAWMCGTVRTLKEGLNAQIEEQMARIAEGVASGWGAQAELGYQYGYPATVNHPEETEFAVSVATDVVGEALVNADRGPVMGSEDFSYMLEERPGSYVFLGQGDTAGLHHPEYDFNDEVMPIGASYFARLVETAQPV